MPNWSDRRFLLLEPRGPLPAPYRYFAATAEVLSRALRKRPVHLPVQARDTGPARGSRRAPYPAVSAQMQKTASHAADIPCPPHTPHPHARQAPSNTAFPSPPAKAPSMRAEEQIPSDRPPFCAICAYSTTERAGNQDSGRFFFLLQLRRAPTIIYSTFLCVRADRAQMRKKGAQAWAES